MVHFHSTDIRIRNACPGGNDPDATGSGDARRVTCPQCLAAIKAAARGDDETAKDAPAVKR